MKDTTKQSSTYTPWVIQNGGFARDMTLRDYFAGLAMQGLIDNDSLFSEIPLQAYALADAMLKERSK